MDKFKIVTLESTNLPQILVWQAMHQDYSEEFVASEVIPFKSEKEAGKLIIKHLLKGGRGHYGVFENPQITVNVGYFPHTLMQQIRTHRVGVSFDVQSGRYTGKRIIKVANRQLDPEDVFYIRPVGEYTDRKGKRYEYTEQQRQEDLKFVLFVSEIYRSKIQSGLSEEHARQIIPYCVRQHFVMSCNARSLMHILDLRWKADAQLEAQKFSELLFDEFKEWMPEVADWYLQNRAKKARLSP